MIFHHSNEKLSQLSALCFHVMLFTQPIPVAAHPSVAQLLTRDAELGSITHWKNPTMTSSIGIDYQQVMERTARPVYRTLIEISPSSSRPCPNCNESNWSGMNVAQSTSSRDHTRHFAN